MDVVLEIRGMNCSNCEKTVIDGLLNLNGVNDVEVYLDAGKLNVNYDQIVVSLEEITELIQALGYEVNK